MDLTHTTLNDPVSLVLLDIYRYCLYVQFVSAFASSKAFFLIWVLVGLNLKFENGTRKFLGLDWSGDLSMLTLMSFPLVFYVRF